MAAQHGYGKMAGTDALEFAYDTGDSRNSFIGEPTTNLVISPDGNANVITTDVPFGTNVSGYAQYSDGYFVNPRNTTSTAATGKTFTYSVWMRSRSATPSTYLMYVFTGTGPDGGWWYFGDGPLTQDWTRHTYTRSDMTGVISQVTVYRYNQQGTIEIAAPQIEEKPHATQFVNGTRSATQGLLDLTGNATVNLTNASFNSNSQMVFDGTDDYLTTSNFQQLSNWSAELLIKPAVFTLSQRILLDVHLGIRFEISNGFFNSHFGNGNGWIYTNLPSTTRISANTFFHVTVTVSSGNQARVYVNGILENSTNIGFGTTPIGPIYIGRYTVDVGYEFNGEIPVAKIYSKSLTANEVLQNFKKYQTRFGIA